MIQVIDKNLDGLFL